MKKTIDLKTYAKINISLDVTGVRENGYHEVAMVMQAVDLYDEMTVSIVPADENSINLTCSRPDIPTDMKNTAYKAAHIIAEEYLNGDKKYAIEIQINKLIPAEAGLAGGSSNAAGVLMGLNSLLELNLPLERLCALGKRIGADVPFCIMALAAAAPELGVSGGSACALAEGIGEILTPLPSADMWAVLAKPPAGVSTAVVYKALDAISDYPHPDTEMVIKGIKEKDSSLIRSGMANVLENVTLRDFPEVADLKKMMSSYDDGITMMSGSGPTVFSLFGDREKAQVAFNAVKESLEGRDHEVFCVATI
ncbi:MAG: 4-(cytidine 5'-diphospho)-2-C-methyl-D-erythritol kinase [Firmicutes bacterium]|nr:4-(cytidine 5'-diphospho)-2-C-methyl-D-erythritol kinase [Bacillota bacterium]